ncbi:MAG: ROK family protein [Caldilineae bacterium]|nr:MAG: ROK family protein [Caldilineae bacterium]
MEILGIDIGGSGIKGALVNAETGELLTERRRIPTPDPSTPDAVAEVVAAIVKHFDWKGLVGCTFPAVIRNGVVYTAANVDKSWIGTDAKALFEKYTGCSVTIINDADAAGIAEMVFGAGRDAQGVVMMVTLGTGIGTALFVDGHLAPNTELGHIEIDGVDAEIRTSDAARKREDLSWKKWGKRLNRYFQTIEFLLSPDLFIIGGGVSKKADKYFKYIDVRARMVVAQMGNHAGIIGGAMAAHALTTQEGEMDFDPNVLMAARMERADA